MSSDALKFRIYYGVWDGREKDYVYWTYNGCGFADALNADTEGVQHIIQENPTKPDGYDVINQKDFYVWREDQGWIGMDQAGVSTYLREKGIPKHVIFGYNMRNDAYHECLRRALREGLGE